MTTRKIFAVSLLLTTVGLMLTSTALACTAPEPTAVPTDALAPAVAASLTATPLPTDMPTSLPTPMATATPEPTPTSTSVPPTYTPAPTFTPKPLPTATLQPTPTRTPGPTRTPRPTSTPRPPSPIASLENGAWLERNEQARAAEIGELPWVADGVDNADERTAAEALIACARWYPDVLNSLLQKTWVRDDITASETTAILRLRWAAKYSPEIGQDILRKPWIQDDVTSAEATGIEYLYWTGRNIPELADKMLQKSWLEDGITADEATVIQELYWIARPEDETFQQQVIDVAIRILDMPFLESVESADALAVRSLSRLENNNTTDFLGIMSHPKISDGITDEEAKIVALLGGTHEYRPESVDFLLRGTGVYLEERTVKLPHSGATLLTIVRIRDKITPSMDFLEHSVRTIEEFMGEPLPTNYIALLYDDAVLPGSGGTNFGTHMTMSLLYDVENGVWWDYTPHLNRSQGEMRRRMG